MRGLTRELWLGVGAPAAELERLTVSDTGDVLPSVFRVTETATASVAAATLAVAGLWQDRGGPPAAATVDTGSVGYAFSSERWIERVGEPWPPIWDPIAGVYHAADGWIRLHTNFAAHRAAALRVLGVPGDRERVAAAVRGWPAQQLEPAVLDAGGAAAALRSAAQWRGGAQAAALASLPLVTSAQVGAAGPAPRVPAPAPLAGVRVLDLTRVIAGPVAGRFLAAYGAEVLRIDGPAVEDSPVLIADTTVGKRAAVLDLREPAGRERFERLVRGADVVLQAYRPGALDGLGYGPAELAELRPGLVVGTLSAYGGVGPWGGRRGFDSLVQFATGIADEGRRAAGTEEPVPLPAQALDHATGYLLALGVVSALRRRLADGGSWAVGVSLARTAGWLDGVGRAEPAAGRRVAGNLVDFTGPLGHTRHVPCPGEIAGYRPRWSSPPRPLGHDQPEWH
jgi:crotonobetainyl-CoA:carnitine CoA-transferase CaiB-like acyl-CoA transferase